MNTIRRTSDALYAPVGATRPGIGLGMLMVTPVVAQIGGLFHQHVSAAILAVVLWVCVGLLLLTPLTLHARRGSGRIRFLFLGCIPVRGIDTPAGLRVGKREGRGSVLFAEMRPGAGIRLVDTSDPFYAEVVGRELSALLGVALVLPQAERVTDETGARVPAEGPSFFLLPEVSHPPSLESFAGRGRLQVRRMGSGCELRCRRGINMWTSNQAGYLGCGVIASLAFGALALLNVAAWWSGPAATRLGFLHDMWFYGFSLVCGLLGVLVYQCLKPQPPLVLMVTADAVSINTGAAGALVLPVDDIAESACVLDGTEESSYLGLRSRSGRLFTISDLDPESLAALEGAIKAAIREMRSADDSSGSQRPPSFVRLR